MRLNTVNSSPVGRCQHRRSRDGGGRRVLRYPFHRCLACRQRLDPRAAQEGVLTVYEPGAVVTIRFRVCQPCARNLDPDTDAATLLSRLATWYTRALRPLPRHP